MKMKTNKKLKRAFSMALLVLLSALIFALPCFAYSPPLLIDGSGNISVDTTRSFAFVNSDNQVVIYGYKFRNPTFPDYDGYNIYVDGSVLNIFSTIPYSSFTFIPLGSNITLSDAIDIVDDYIDGYINGATGLYVQEITVDILSLYKQHLINTTLEDLRFTIQYLSTSEIGQEIISEAIPSFDYNEQLAAINNATTIEYLYTLDSSYSTALTLLSTACFDYIMANGTYQDGYDVGYTLGYEQGYLAGEQSNSAYQNGYNIGYGVGLNEGYSNGYDSGYDTGFDDGDAYGYNNGYNDGYDTGFDEGYFDGNADGLNSGYNTGYTDGATDSGYMKNTLITIFSSPYYILNEVFNFEIFDVSVVGIIMFVISIIIVGFVIKTII